MPFIRSARFFGLKITSPVEFVLTISASVIFKPNSVHNSIASSKYLYPLRPILISSFDLKQS